MATFRQRIPKALRYHWGWLAAGVAVVAILALVWGSSMVRPTITSALATGTQSTHTIAGTTDPFDGGDHEITIAYSETEYQDMIDKFQSSGEKNFVKATMTIDGTEIDNVGIRLKGNSTIRSLQGDMGQAPAEATTDAAADQRPAGGMASLSVDEPENLPWLVSFDEFEEGRTDQGHYELSLRPAVGDLSIAVVEQLALDLAEETGQASQELRADHREC